MTVSQLPGPAARTAPDQPVVQARWRPTRAGILNVWRYYDEVLEFHKGRLLLRGPNGTGKSKALELLLPFLFDASLRANRLSTFGTGDRSMHWNLMGEGAGGVTRVGYVWLEFGHPESEAGWFCCGARLQASAHTSTVHADYFTTSQRVGLAGGLALVNSAGQPLTRAALAEALGEHGDLHGSATDYRAAVRHTLFPGLSEQRYEALITALLQLRTPKLSERLDPGLLSTLLSRALPPLGQAEISELAEGFERLDRQREHLARLDVEVQAAQTVAARQRGYAQRVLRAGAAALISATSELDKLARTARESEERYQVAVADRAAAEASKQTLDHREGELRATIDGLTGSEQYRKGQELDRLRQHRVDADLELERLRDQSDRSRHTAEVDAGLAEAAEQIAKSMAAGVDAAEQDSRHAAERAGMMAAHTEIRAAVDIGQRRARQLLRAAVGSRHQQVDAVRKALERHAAAVRARGAAEGDLELARAALAKATTHRSECGTGYDEAFAEQAERLRSWAAELVELVIEDREALAERADSESGVLELVVAAADRASQGIAGIEAATSAERQARYDELAQLVIEVERLSRQVDLPPKAPRTRTADRSTMDGAPLWKLVSFRDSVSARTQAGVEAALEASGLLDAWVSLRGDLTVAGHDTFADAHAAEPVSGGSLIEVLRPEPDGPVPADRVHRLLAAIGYGLTLPSGPAAAVSADGRWRLATATGSWSKDDAAHIGALARERARERRIAELNEQLESLRAVVAELDHRLQELAARRDRLDQERRSRPDHRGIDEAKRALDRAEAEVGARDDAVSRQLTRLAECEAVVSGALRELTASAAEHGLPAERDALDQLHEAVNSVRESTDGWLDGYFELLGARAAARTATEQANRSRSLAGQQQGEVERAAAKARELAARLEAVESTIGADYREVLAKITELRREAREVKDQTEELGRVLLELATSIGSLGQKRTTDSLARETAVAARDQAAARFRQLCAGSFPADGHVQLTLSPADGVKPTLDASRAVAAKWPSMPYETKNLTDALGRLTEAVHTCRQALAERADLELEPDEDIQVLAVTMDGIRIGAAQLLETLQTERERSAQDITAAERELFDKTLTGDTRRHLAARIRQASALVDEMNARLERVRTASKVAVRLVWQVDPGLPAGTREARDLLLKDPVRLTDADRDALHRFFRDRIEEAKAANTAANWEAQLAQVFDYTAWHQFVVKLDRANGAGWQQLTKKLHGALSGGEKAIALHLPLFAAVAAHYQSVAGAPRLILLDEVFVGVDTTNRGQVFELLASLDLDLMLTSDHEWCTYRELEGIAIHQLITGGDGDDAVTTARFTWDGLRLLPDPAPEQP